MFGAGLGPLEAQDRDLCGAGLGQARCAQRLRPLGANFEVQEGLVARLAPLQPRAVGLGPGTLPLVTGAAVERSPRRYVPVADSPILTPVCSRGVAIHIRGVPLVGRCRLLVGGNQCHQCQSYSLLVA